MSISAQAKNYYFSSSSGNDSYTSTQAQNQATPWRSTSKLNSYFINLVAGDSILFRRGDFFYGSIVVRKSGTSGKPIVIAAYGSGDKPVISGLITLSSWSALGNGVYQAQAPAVKNSVNVVTLNDELQAVGRYPNADAENGGYLSYESYSGTSSITDNQLGATNWTGAEVVIRKKHFALEKCKITGQSNNTISYTTTLGNYPAKSSDPTPATGTNGYGYFIQRDRRTLDQLGEWYFDNGTKRMQMYFGSNNPSSYNIQVSTLDTLINIGSQKYITLNNIALEGGNFAGIFASSSGNITIQSCDLSSMGGKGIFIHYSGNILIDGVNTNNILCGAIDINSTKYSNVTVRNCNLKNTGMIAGMGSFWSDTDYKGICINVLSNALVEYNNLENTGFMGIQFIGSDIMIKNNFINYYNIVKDDGGGIYSYQLGTDADPGTIYTNRTIKENIVMNGIGAIGGSIGNIDVDGIFLDGRITNVDVINNSIANVGVNGIYTNNAVNMEIRGNTCFNNGNGIGLTRYTLGYFKNLSIKQNIIYPKYDIQNNMAYQDNGVNMPSSSTIEENMQRVGDIDSNYFSTPNATGFTYRYPLTEGGKWSFPLPMSFEGWKSFTGHDKRTKLPPKKIETYKVNSLVGSNKVPSGQFTSGLGSIVTTLNNILAVWDVTGKITGIGSLKITPLSSSTNFTQVTGSVGAVSSAKKYLLRVTTLGSAANGVIRVYIAKSSATETILTPVETENFGTSKRVHEFLFAAPVSDANASFIIEVQQASGATYIDDIAFYETNATLLDIDDQLRFEYNATKTVKTVSLNANYVGVDGVSYPGVVTLQPYTSRVLIKDTGVVKTGLVVLAAKSADINCFGGTTAVTVSASGGTAPYTGTGTFNVKAGTYTYTARDSRGVTGTATITITQPLTALRASVTAGTIASYGGTTTTTVTATGGTPPYSGTGSFTVTAGTYRYTVRDDNGCTSTASIVVTQPVIVTGLTASAAVSPVNCFGASTTVAVTAAGGITPYKGTGNFTVNAGTRTLKIGVNNPQNGAYTLIYGDIGAVSPAKNYVLKFSTLGTTDDGELRAALRLTNSPWTVFTDVQTGSFGTDRVDHEFLFTSPPGHSATSFEIDILQSSGTVYIDNIAFYEADDDGILSGNNRFDGGNFEDGITGITAWSESDNHTIVWDNTSKISNTYYYTVTDASGASSVAVAEVTQAASALTVSVTAGTIPVYGGSTNVRVTASGGNPPYTGTGTFNVEAGNYTYVVTDENGCSKSVSIVVTQPPSQTTLVSTATTPAINCFGSNATVTIGANGGSKPYKGTGNFSVNAGKGSLRVSVNGPVEDEYVFLNSSIGPTSSSKNYVLRFSTLGTTSNGRLQVALRQTNSPWDNITEIQSASFGTNRKDHHFLFQSPGNLLDASFLIQILQTSGTTYIDNIACFESTASGKLIGPNLYPTGQFENEFDPLPSWTTNDNHSVSWDNTGKISSIYYFNVTDDDGSSSVAIVPVTQPGSPLAASASVTTPIATAGGTGRITVTASGGTAPYTGTGSFTVTAGTYTYTVRDSKGCSTSATITITQSQAGLIATSYAPAIRCYNGPTAITVSATGGTAPYSGDGAFEVTAGTGSLRLSFNSSVNDEYALLYSTIGAVSSSKNYMLRFTTLGTRSTGSLRASLRLTNSPWTAITGYQSRSFGTSRTDHQFLFTAPPSRTEASFLIEVLQSSGTVYIDNIAFLETDDDGTIIGDNVYSGGQFENGIGNIETYTNNNNLNATWDVSSKIANTYYYVVTDAEGAKSTTFATPSQPASSLKADATAPNISNPGGSVNVTVTASGGTGPYTGTGIFSAKAGTHTYTVTDANLCKTTTTVTITEAGARTMGAANTAAVNTRGAIISPVSEVSTGFRITTYPNPSDTEFGLMVEGGSRETVYITVLSVDGRIVYEAKGNSNAKYIFGKRFVPGIYIVKAIQGSTSRILSVVKTKF